MKSRILAAIVSIALCLGTAVWGTGCVRRPDIPAEWEHIDLSSPVEGNGSPVTVWWARGSGESGTALEQTYEDAVERFYAANPSARGLIETVYKGTGDYEGMLRTALLTNTEVPDVVRLNCTQIQALGAQRLLVNLSELTDDAETLKDKYVESCWTASSLDGDCFALPFDANTTVLFYNETAFENAGIDKAPATYPEFLRDCEILRGYIDAHPDDQLKYPFTVPCKSGEDGGFAAFNYNGWIAREGGGILNDDFSTSAMQSDEVRAAAQKYRYLADHDYVNKTDFQEGAFFNGEVAMIEMGPWQIQNIENAKKLYGIDIGFSQPFSFHDNVKPYTTLGLYSLCMLNQSKNKRLAYAFTRFMATDERFVTDYCRYSYLLPANTDLLQNDLFETERMLPFKLQLLNNTVPRPCVPSWPKIQNYVKDCFVKIISGQDIDKQLKACDTKINRVL